MDIISISDTHNKHNELIIPPCDVLIHCGDFTSSGTFYETQDFIEWFASQESKHKILVCGNHDLYAWEEALSFKNQCKLLDVNLLEDSQITIDGVKFYGSPWVPTLNKKRWGYYIHKSRVSELKTIWAKIPSDTDILITHVPPKGILDETDYPKFDEDQNLGCEHLLERILKVKPKLHYFGHVHERGGSSNNKYTIFINASSMRGRYKNEPLRRPILHRYG